MAETGKGVVGVDLWLQASSLLHIKELGAEGVEKLLQEILWGLIFTLCPVNHQSLNILVEETNHLHAHVLSHQWCDMQIIKIQFLLINC